jgi:isocitrate dehydrogenase
MKLTDGIFHKVFDEIGKEYPDIEQEHMIIDIGTARLADTPERFNVVVVPNLYGDILSDVASQLTGSVGLGVSSNIGDTHAMFEAVHGSAPDIAGRGIANPSGLLLAAVPMLVHIGQPDVAEKIHNAWKRTIEDGIHTGDIYRPERSQKRVSTDEFADAVIERLGQQPEILRPVSYAGLTITKPHNVTTDLSHIEKDLVGVDVFLDWDEADRDPNVIGKALSEAADNEELALVMITNRGQKYIPMVCPKLSAPTTGVAVSNTQITSPSRINKSSVCCSVFMKVASISSKQKISILSMVNAASRLGRGNNAPDLPHNKLSNRRRGR